MPSDVATNQAGGKRAGSSSSCSTARFRSVNRRSAARRIAAAAINQLGPGDLAAVVSTSNGAVQNLTSDRARLLRAISESDLSTDISDEAKEIEAEVFALTGRTWSTLNDGRCQCGLCVLETITRVADAVQGTPRRRKVLFFIGSDLLLQAAGSPGDARNDVGCENRLTDAREAMFSGGGSRQPDDSFARSVGPRERQPGHQGQLDAAAGQRHSAPRSPTRPATISSARAICRSCRIGPADAR